MDYFPFSIPVLALLGYMLVRYLQDERTARRMKNDLSLAKHPLNVVITGGSRGIGYSIASQFLKGGHHVIICGRDGNAVKAAVDRLRADTRCSLEAISGTACDVGKYEDVKRLVDFAVERSQDNGIDLWINNAGNAGAEQGKFTDISPQAISSVFETNVTGLAYCCRAATFQMLKQPQGGHIANMDGRGRPGSTLSYGASKAAVVSMTKMLSKEYKDTKVGFHVTQPGMCLTKLLVKEGQTPATRRIFNILAEDPDIMAKWMTGKLTQLRGTGRHIAYLTPLSVAWRFLTAPTRRNRFFDGKTGKYTYRKELLE